MDQYFSKYKTLSEEAMRSKKAIFIGIVVMLLGAVSVVGCGDSDLLDELPLRYTVSMSTTDLGETTRDVDFVRSDCDGEPEDFGDWGAVATIAADSNTADLIVYGYTITFVPRTGQYWDSDGAAPDSAITMTNFTPPPTVDAYSNLSPIVHNYNTPLVMQNGILEDIPIHVWSPGQKDFYIYTLLQTDFGLSDSINVAGVEVAIEAETLSFTYDYRVVFHCSDSEDGDFDLEAWEIAIFDNWDNC